MEKVHLKRTRRIHERHLWVFSNELYESPKKYSPGDLVELYDLKENFLGTGYINPHSLIAVRILTTERLPVEREFFLKRIGDALALRKRLFKEDSDALRLVFSEGDYLPGLIADRYSGCLVLQFLTAGMERFKDTIVAIFDELLAPETIVIRNESRSRTLEGLPLYKEVVEGNLDTLPIVREGGISFEVDPFMGQKTGFFIDQRENRAALTRFVGGGEGLDLFCYTGGWSLNLAAAGARVTGVDESERAVAQAKRNAWMNGLQERAVFVREDVFSFLEREFAAGQRRLDFIVLDPPAFVKSAGRIKEAVRAYRQLNASCMKLLRSGGILATSSCSYHLGREMFLEMLRLSARDAGRSPRMLYLRSQAPDHPVLLSMPETEYLKCAFLQMD
jgi:23S rRNA (cytosine1962-C5)-methyltransferase